MRTIDADKAKERNDLPDTNVGETISRQQAIDAISCDITITGRRNAEIVSETIASFVDRIKALPPAEPQLVECDPLLAANKVAQGRLLSAYYYLDVLKDFSEMGYVLAKRREI